MGEFLLVGRREAADLGFLPANCQREHRTPVLVLLLSDMLWKAMKPLFLLLVLDVWGV